MAACRTHPFSVTAAAVLVLTLVVNFLQADAPVRLWSSTWSGYGAADAQGLAVSADAIYVTGNTEPAPGTPGDLLLLKYNLAGNLQWARSWPDSPAYYDGGAHVAIQPDAVYVAGSTDTCATWLRDAITLKYSLDGVLDTSHSSCGWWTKFSGDTDYHGYNYAADLVFDDAGNMYVVGSTERAYNNIWTYVQKYNAQGVLQWHQNYGSFVGGGNGSNGLVRCGENLYTAGHTGRGGNVQVLALKYTTVGALVWAYEWGGSTTDQSYAVAVDGNDLYYTGRLGDSLLVLKLHDDGPTVRYLGSAVFGETGAHLGHGITVGDGKVYVVGSTTVGDNTDAVLLAYDTDLRLLWSHIWSTPANDSANGIAYRNGILYVSGTMGNQAFLDAYSTRGDLNCDGVVNFDDINPFVLALSDPAGYRARYPGCNSLNADCNGDGVVNFEDINCFVTLLSHAG